MKVPLIVLAIFQSALLCTAQTMLKIAMMKLQAFSLSLGCIKELLTNVWLLFSGICFVCSGMLWMYILRHFPFSHAYPLVSLSYVLGMFVAVFIFKEQVFWQQWLGVFLIVSGCAFIVQ